MKMTIFKLIIKEIRNRFLTTIIFLIAVSLPITIIVAIQTINISLKDEVRRLMRDMGTNIIIVPKDIRMDNYWTGDFGNEEMPEEYVTKLASTPGISADHFIAKLQSKTEIGNVKVVLCGVLPELGSIGKRKKTPMGFIINNGEVFLGKEVAEKLKVINNNKLEILNRSFHVTKVLPEMGTSDDIKIFMHLHDLQSLLNKGSVINLIETLGCLCYGDFLSKIKDDISKVLPDTKVIPYRSIAIARTDTRLLVQKLAITLLIILSVLSGLAVANIMFLNIRERKQEIGIFMAIGLHAKKIFSLFLFKILIISVIGGIIGYFLGSLFALYFGPQMVQVPVKLMSSFLVWSILYAMALSLVSSSIPMIKLVKLDPAKILMKE